MTRFWGLAGGRKQAHDSSPVRRACRLSLAETLLAAALSGHRQSWIAPFLKCTIQLVSLSSSMLMYKLVGTIWTPVCNVAESQQSEGVLAAWYPNLARKGCEDNAQACKAQFQGQHRRKGFLWMLPSSELSSESYKLANVLQLCAADSVAQVCHQ